MLDVAFLETADYKTLIDAADRPIVVGRRGTGKSALAHRLQKHWREASKTDVILLAPAEEQIIGLRAIVPEFFSDQYRLIRAGARIAWRFALLAEIACRLAKHYKLERTAAAAAVILKHAAEWPSLGSDVSARLRRRLLEIGVHLDASGRIAEIAGWLEVDKLQNAIETALTDLKHQAVVLVDKVDEGYEPDRLGVAMVDALVLAAVDLNTRLDNVRVNLFLRDNMARAVEQLDPDFSRDIEGQILRLHWEENQLFSLVCSRLRVAFSLDLESDVKTWNRCAASTLQGRDGFRKCLRLTLYRPRDILALLNEAFLHALRDNRDTIVESDITATALRISKVRLDDLHKEYSAVLPGLNAYTARFAEGVPEMAVSDSHALLAATAEAEGVDEAAAQTFALLDSATDVGAALYSVGFIGLKDPGSGAVAFCHDGRSLDRALSPQDRVMVHPCYWMALGLKEAEVEPALLSEIYDEYDIKVVSSTPEIRRTKLGQLIGQLDRLPIGDEGAVEFEDWCLRAVQVIFAAQLTNITHHSNGNAIQRRDVVATNHGRSEAWRRILDDYKARQIVFEIKNYAELGPAEYRQMNSYLMNDYGRLGFIITRSNDENLLADRELPWMREIYSGHHKLVVKLTGRFLARVLSKLRSPQRHDEADVQLNRLLDVYTRNYLGEQIVRRRRKRR